MATIAEIEGIGPAYAAKLMGAGVETTGDLLERGSTADGRAVLASSASVSPKLVLEWVNHADLLRVAGVGSEYADLLEEAGVDSVPELAQRNAANLHAVLVAANEAKALVRQLPSEKQVAGWIEEAKGLPRVVTH